VYVLLTAVSAPVLSRYATWVAARLPKRRPAGEVPPGLAPRDG